MTCLDYRYTTSAESFHLKLNVRFSSSCHDLVTLTENSNHHIQGKGLGRRAHSLPPMKRDLRLAEEFHVLPIVDEAVYAVWNLAIAAEYLGIKCGTSMHWKKMRDKRGTFTISIVMGFFQAPLLK